MEEYPFGIVSVMSIIWGQPEKYDVACSSWMLQAIWVIICPSLPNRCVLATLLNHRFLRFKSVSSQRAWASWALLWVCFQAKDAQKSLRVEATMNSDVNVNSFNNPKAFQLKDIPHNTSTNYYAWRICKPNHILGLNTKTIRKSCPTLSWKYHSRTNIIQKCS